MDLSYAVAMALGLVAPASYALATEALVGPLVREAADSEHRMAGSQDQASDGSEDSGALPALSCLGVMLPFWQPESKRGVSMIPQSAPMGQ